MYKDNAHEFTKLWKVHKLSADIKCLDYMYYSQEGTVKPVIEAR